MQRKNQGQFALTIIVALVVGAIAGAFGSFFLKPYLESYHWGQEFLGNNPIVKNANTKVYKVTEESSTIDVVKDVSPSVVSIVITKELSNYYNLTGPNVFDYWNFSGTLPQEEETQKREVGGGTGFVIDSEGLILTNKHVVSDLEAEYSVIFNDGTKHEATVLGRDPVNDIAILKIEATDLPVVDLGDSDDLEIGQTVIAIGNALSEYQNTVTRGVISGIDRQIVAGDNYGKSEVLDGAIQTDAAINPGNSGGPLLNLDGQVIGINTAVNWQGRSIGFAIPVNQAKNVIESVKEFGEIIRPWLGVRYVQLNAEIAGLNNLDYENGALVVRGDSETQLAVVPDSPADKAGLVENDIILEVNGVKLDGEHTLLNEIAKYKPDEQVELKIVHDGEEKVITVILVKREE
ncbi:trypsin-like serine protease [Candidatus Falkowbacteria bacterium]|jgi:serine protease Do|nr:trypsin-like serine protease [Candidatus Falkowbacteria bacterium]MBT5503643.1 trypsin-like serine protease [Candidatus Falkowbacteria bacterium]MBT6574107.1 trypsin-like serine protease [Candidatus Falkowbacteria bacterium]MBT7500687.1 trypsin-like serine protease [Candidatus Falkowbacteria bacterium]